MASICCSPPESVPAILAEALFQAWEAGEDLFEVLGDAFFVFSSEGAHLQVFQHGEAAENLAPLGDLDHAALDDFRARAGV